MTAKTPMAVTCGTATNCHATAIRNPLQLQIVANDCQSTAPTAISEMAIGVGSMAVTGQSGSGVRFDKRAVRTWRRREGRRPQFPRRVFQESDGDGLKEAEETDRPKSALLNRG